ncbi:T9SS C-terminal target domain-containing protein [Pontibacter diazotrophicus]|uniref:T9SS C-terminal target domain-containing protein n=1 Tax=Pontibacter diazotrophicus TaxID=1400979 RepID=A0A3D8LFA6_9BACT|nr:T9SS type A sorting domain-containing protein [Pontibacter diazotrophicus]RDV15934.1 T9SS C-terminal target domain-containing protein [Pontibacter diazotrophicus]
MRKPLVLILFFLWSGVAAMAQAILQPLQQEMRQIQRSTAKPLRSTAAAAVSLPFFDDFAATTVAPDPSRWQNGGVYINNRFGFEPITINVATFDGLNAAGQPYVPESVGAGASDTLTSEPILLGSLNPGDSVYLSFYWQSGGIGDVPDLTESNLRYLQLEFKDNTGTWNQVWRQPAPGVVTDFAQVFVGLREPRYFHDDFQFRFRNVGQRNGLADVWNVDYVELGSNRSKGQNTTRDIAISEGVSKLLEHYTAMPARQFRANPTGELAEEVRATLNNLGGLPGAISWRGYIKQLNEATADTFLRGQALIPGAARQYEVTGTPTLDAIQVPASGPFTLLHGIRLDTREQDPLQRANDSTERKTNFADYYAYDDGTAEAGFSFLGTGNVQVAQRFDLNEPDQLSGFRVYFPRVGRDLSGSPLIFKIWAEQDSVPGETLHQQSFQIQYSDTLNEFYEVQLSKLVPVEGSFYIGWSQGGNTYVNIGFDKNERATDRRFTYTPSGGWIGETTLEGAIMMRPVLVGEALGVEDDLAAASMRVFPNPSRGEVFINEPYEQVSVFDITGKKVHSQTYAGPAQPINLRHLAPGLYTLRIQTRKAIVNKKLILTKL